MSCVIKGVHCTCFHQVTTKNKIQLLDDPLEEMVNQLAAKLGLVPVGWIFTDLVADDLSKGTVKNFRGNMVSRRTVFEKICLCKGIIKPGAQTDQCHCYWLLN